MFGSSDSATLTVPFLPFSSDSAAVNSLALSAAQRLWPCAPALSTVLLLALSRHLLGIPSATLRSCLPNRPFHPRSHLLAFHLPPSPSWPSEPLRVPVAARTIILAHQPVLVCPINVLLMFLLLSPSLHVLLLLPVPQHDALCFNLYAQTTGEPPCEPGTPVPA